MKKRILSFLLALVMTASCVPSVWAEEEARMAVAVSTRGGVVIEPQYVTCGAGETVWQVLSRMEGHTFTEGAGGFITEIDGVVGNYSRFDSRGGYALDAEAAAAGAFVFTEAEVADAAAYCDMVCAMADCSESLEAVRRYAAEAYDAAEAALSADGADYAALAQALRERMAAYDREVIGAEKAVLRLSVTDLDGAAVEGYDFAAVNPYGTEFRFAAGEELKLAAGEYDFTVTAGYNGARGSMTVSADGTVTVGGETVTALELPCGKEWLKAPVLHRTSGKLEGDGYPMTDAAESHSAVCYVPDAVTASYLYCPEGDDLADGTAYTTGTVRPVCYYTDRNGTAREKTGSPWSSKASSLAAFLDASGTGNTVVAEAQYTAGYTRYQQYTLTVVRTPTLAELAVTAQGVAVNIGFAPETETYEVTVTAETVTVTPDVFTEDCAVTVNGQAAVSGQGVTVTLAEEDTSVTVTVARNGQERTYTLTVHRVQAVAVELLHDSDVTARVFNSAGAEIGAAQRGAERDRFDLIPGETYTYVTDKETWYHAAGSFIAQEGLTVTAQTPETEDALDSLYLATVSTAVARNKKLCLSVPSGAAHSYSLSVTDFSANLYCWVQNGAYTFTVAETGDTIRQKAVTAAGQVLSRFLKTGAATQTLTIRAERGEGETKYYQEYRITLYKTPTLTDGTGVQLAVEGAEMPLTRSDGSVGFDRDVTAYSATIARSADSALLTLKPYDAAYYVYVNGVRRDVPEGESVVTVQVALDGAKDTETVFITAGSSRTPEGAQRRTYQLTLRKKDAVPTAFRVTDTEGREIPGALVCVYDGRTQERVWPGSDGAFALVDTLSYTYVATCAGYVGATGTMTAGEDGGDIAVTLAKAPETSHGAGVTSSWSSFRGSDSANGVIDAKTPIAAENAVLSWASKLGEGYSSGAVGSPILITEDGYDYLITYAADRLFKVDALSGQTVAEGRMDHSSSFAITSPTYAEGMVFVGLSNGAVQAFDAATLESLWIYRDTLGGQPNCPITYHDGYIYTGFWNSEVAQANLVCLSVTDEDPANATEEKLPSWTYASAGGFYWAGAYVCDDYLLIGTDDGTGSCTAETAALLCIDPATGRRMDAVTGLKGDIRCNIAYDGGRFYFTSKGGYFYSVAAPVKDGEDWVFDKASLRSVALENGGDAGHPAMSTCTPVVYNGRAYVGVSGTGQFTAYSGHSITVIDLTAWKIAYSVPTQGYPQTSGLLTTAYEGGKETVYVYFFDNYTPGKLRVLKDAPGQTKAVLTTQESYTVQDRTTVYDTPYVLFTPAGAQAQYAICSPIADGSGTVYFKNDSAYLMALSSTVTELRITKLPDKLSYVAGETFDPTGMEIAVTYENGVTRTLPARRTVNGRTIDYFTWKTTPLTVRDGEDFMIRFAGSLYQDGEDGAGTRVYSPPALLTLTVEAPASGDVNGDGLRDVTDLQNLFVYLSTGVMEGAYSGDAARYLAEADVNGDGNVDILDYQALYTLIASGKRENGAEEGSL